MKVDTVKIKSADGFVTINKSDFDAKIHTKFGAKPVAKKTASKSLFASKKKKK